jgi:hypothetical protein
MNIKDPFNSAGQKDPFESIMKNPFENDMQKNPFESGNDAKEEAPFKDSGLTMGLNSLNSRQTAMPMNSMFKASAPSPIGGYFGQNSDGNMTKNAYTTDELGYLSSRNQYGADSNRYAYYNPYGKMPGQILSPSGAASSHKVGKGDKKMNEASPKMDMINNVFETPTSKGVFNHKFVDISNKKDEVGSFGASPRDISTTKAVFNQQTKFAEGKKEYEIPTPQRNMGRDMMTPSAGFYFANSPYGYVNYQNAFVGFSNTPTGGSFGASPAAWQFNMPSPHTGNMQQMNMSPFNPNLIKEQKT